MTVRERRLLKIAFAPWMMRYGDPRLPTFDEWLAAWDELFPEVKG